MAWTTPTTRATGYLVTASDWNTDLVDNLAYLKGQAGDVTMEAGILSDTDVTDDLGSTSILWKDIYARTLHGSRMRVNPNIRETRLTWEDDAFANIQVTATAVGAGSVAAGGGTGQMVLKVDNDAGGARSARIDQQTEQNNALDNAWTVSKKPYIRLEFSLNAEDANAEFFAGFRATPGALAPVTTEIHAGLVWTGGPNWVLSTGDGTTTTSTNLTTDPTAGSRNVLEIYINSATEVELWLNGVKQLTKTTNLPTGTLEWSILMATDGLGGASDSILTVGQVIIQEEL